MVCQQQKRHTIEVRPSCSARVRDGTRAKDGASATRRQCEGATYTWCEGATCRQCEDRTVTSTGSADSARQQGRVSFRVRFSPNAVHHFWAPSRTQNRESVASLAGYVYCTLENRAEFEQTSRTSRNITRLPAASHNRTGPLSFSCPCNDRRTHPSGLSTMLYNLL